MQSHSCNVDIQQINWITQVRSYDNLFAYTVTLIRVHLSKSFYNLSYNAFFLKSASMPYRLRVHLLMEQSEQSCYCDVRLFGRGRVVEIFTLSNYTKWIVELWVHIAKNCSSFLIWHFRWNVNIKTWNELWKKTYNSFEIHVIILKKQHTIPVYKYFSTITII